jgi:hypothetical protein
MQASLVVEHVITDIQGDRPTLSIIFYSVIHNTLKLLE